MQWSKRPVILIGHGCRASGADVARILAIGIPVLTSWQAKDLVPWDHPMYFGCPGIYGQRAANKILHNADEIYAIGNRCAIWNVGYEGIRTDQALMMVDIDEHEVKKFPHAKWIKMDCKQFVESMEPQGRGVETWLLQCDSWRTEHPFIEAGTHDDQGGFINSYRFTDALHKYLRPDEVIVTDMGTALICAHQVLKLRPPQRLMTSGGLGEMGCALPAAIGASFGRGKGEVLCLTTDGGMMLNLQELQTIKHHNLPIKIIVYRNEGYLMIRHTQKAAKMPESGVDPSSGVSFPDFRKLCYSMDIPATDVFSWDHFDRAMVSLFAEKGPALVQYHMQRLQPLQPKLEYEFVNGKSQYRSFDQMSPLR